MVVQHCKSPNSAKAFWNGGNVNLDFFCKIVRIRFALSVTRLWLKSTVGFSREGSERAGVHVLIWKRGPSLQNKMLSVDFQTVVFHWKNPLQDLTFEQYTDWALCTGKPLFSIYFSMSRYAKEPVSFSGCSFTLSSLTIVGYAVMLDTDLSAYVSDIMSVFFRNMIYGKWNNTICMNILVAENVKKLGKLPLERTSSKGLNGCWYDKH